MSASADITFRSMGSDVRLIIEGALRPGSPSPAQAAEEQRRWIEHFAARLSRFRAESELSQLNAMPAHEVHASPLLRTAVSAGVWAAAYSDGLVDPTLVGALERVGYASSHDGVEPVPLGLALATAPPRMAARAHPDSLWRTIEVDDARGVVRRPVGVQIDTGGIGKGLAADAVAYRLRDYTRFVVDCGGDIAVDGVGAQLQPVAVAVEHPLTGKTVHTLHLTGGGVATSGLNVRIWRTPGGGFAHHLLDPSNGEPVWSGLIGATALAPTALEAETISKMALLSGPQGARRALAAHGGLIVHDDGTVELVGLWGAADDAIACGVAA